MNFLSGADTLGLGKQSARLGVKPKLLIMFFVMAFVGCAVHDPLRPKEMADPEKSSNATVSTAPATETSNSNKKFAEPTDLDKLLDAKPITMAAVKPVGQGSSAGASSATLTSSSSSTSSTRNEKSTSGKANYRLQIGAESTIDAAQAKKAVYEKQLGGTVDMVFDAPYYKLRWGYFDTKQDAEDKLLELSDFKIQGFVVK